MPVSVDGFICASYRYLHHRLGNIMKLRTSTMGVANASGNYYRTPLGGNKGNDRGHKRTKFD